MIFNPDPGFSEGDVVTFSIDGSNQLYEGIIRGCSAKNVITWYIIELKADYLQNIKGYIKPVFSKEYPFTCVNVQHTFIK
jgi:hypothetical protein